MKCKHLEFASKENISTIDYFFALFHCLILFGPGRRKVTGFIVAKFCIPGSKIWNSRHYLYSNLRFYVWKNVLIKYFYFKYAKLECISCVLFMNRGMNTWQTFGDYVCIFVLWQHFLLLIACPFSGSLISLRREKKIEVNFANGSPELT